MKKIITKELLQRPGTNATSPFCVLLQCPHYKNGECIHEGECPLIALSEKETRE